MESVIHLVEGEIGEEIDGVEWGEGGGAAENIGVVIDGNEAAGAVVGEEVDGAVVDAGGAVVEAGGAVVETGGVVEVDGAKVVLKGWVFVAECCPEWVVWTLVRPV